MRHKVRNTTILTIIFALTSVSGFAQGGGQGGGQGAGQANRPAQVDRDRLNDRDRRQVQERVDARALDRDRLRNQDFSKMQDRDIYGSKLMTATERNQYRDQLQNAGTAAERKQIQIQHHEKMQTRANEQGIELVPPGQGSIYGRKLMTTQERNEFRTELRFAESDQQRAQLVAQHREEMQARAREQGVDLEELEEAE